MGELTFRSDSLALPRKRMDVTWLAWGENSRDQARPSWDGSGDPNDVETKVWLQGNLLEDRSRCQCLSHYRTSGRGKVLEQAGVSVIRVLREGVGSKTCSATNYDKNSVDQPDYWGS